MFEKDKTVSSEVDGVSNANPRWTYLVLFEEESFRN